MSTSFKVISVNAVFHAGLMDDGHTSLPGIYAHGQAEQFLGYDLLYRLDSSEQLEDGVTAGMLYHSNHPDDMTADTGLNVCAFVWTANGYKLGYIVSTLDAEAIAFAANQYAAKPGFI